MSQSCLLEMSTPVEFPINESILPVRAEHIKFPSTEKILSVIAEYIITYLGALWHLITTTLWHAMVLQCCRIENSVPALEESPIRKKTTEGDSARVVATSSAWAILEASFSSIGSGENRSEKGGERADGVGTLLVTHRTKRSFEDSSGGGSGNYARRVASSCFLSDRDRKERKHYIDDWALGDEEIEGRRSFHLDEKIETDRFPQCFVKEMQGIGYDESLHFVVRHLVTVLRPRAPLGREAERSSGKRTHYATPTPFSPRSLPPFPLRGPLDGSRSSPRNPAHQSASSKRSKRSRQDKGLDQAKDFRLYQKRTTKNHSTVKMCNNIVVALVRVIIRGLRYVSINLENKTEEEGWAQPPPADEYCRCKEMTKK
uniref:Uncharacterized protein n=1 Tax=Timema monikensis TaxID=170555 RepID=A0A7R9E617_9NEOP|nr:unnamed protein product [Timema monikensis]